MTVRAKRGMKIRARRGFRIGEGINLRPWVSSELRGRCMGGRGKRRVKLSATLCVWEFFAVPDPHSEGSISAGLRHWPKASVSTACFQRQVLQPSSNGPDYQAVEKGGERDSSGRMPAKVKSVSKSGTIRCWTQSIPDCSSTTTTRSIIVDASKPPSPAPISDHIFFLYRCFMLFFCYIDAT